MITSILKNIGTATNLVIRACRNFADKIVDRLSGGRGLKIWSKPNIQTVKSVNNFHEFKLANGLRVLVKQVAGTQISANLVIDAGGAKDPPGKEGLAHLLEHLVCDGTQKFQNNIFAIANLHGGSFNAGTSHNCTEYQVLLPKDKLRLALAIQASFMRPLEINNLQGEKSIIAAESIHHHTTGVLGAIVTPYLLGSNHPYSRSLIGSPSSLASIQLEDLRKFHQEEYIPNNATLVLSGDFDLQELKRYVVQEFGPLEARRINSQPDLSPKPNAQERLEIRDSSLSSAQLFEFPMKGFNHREHLIAKLIISSLAGSLDSRLYKSIVDRGFALNVGARLAMFKDFGSFEITVNPYQNKSDKASLDFIEKLIQAELEKLAAEGLTQEEVSRVIVNEEHAQIRRQDSQHSMIGAVVNYVKNGEDWTKVFRVLEDLKSIKNDEIKAFASKYLKWSKAKKIRSFGQGQDLAKNYAKPLLEGVSAIAKKQITPKVNFAELEKLSGGLSEFEANIKGVQKIKAHGMDVLYRQDSKLPIVLATFSAPPGVSRLKPAEKIIFSLGLGLALDAGIYNPSSKMRIKKDAIEALAQRYGFHYNLSADHDEFTFNCHYLSKYSNEFFAFLSQALEHNALLESQDPVVVSELEKDLQRLKMQTIELLEMRLKKNPQISISLGRLIYPKGHDFYPMDIEEQIAVIKNTSLAEIREYFKNYFHLHNGKAVVSGDISQSKIESELIPIILKTKGETTLPADYSRQQYPGRLPKSQVKIIDDPSNDPESTIVLCAPMDIKLNDPDYFVSQLAMHIFGSGDLDSLLIQELREKSGLVYHAGASINYNKNASGLLTINSGADPRNAKKIIASIMQSIKRFCDQGITAEQLAKAKNYFKATYSLYALNSQRGIHNALCQAQYLDSDETYINTYNQQIDSISVEQVNRVIKKIFQGTNFAIGITKPKNVSLAKEFSETQNLNKDFALAV